MRATVGAALVIAGICSAQSQTAATSIAFEAASIHPAALDATRVRMSGGPGSSDPGRVNYENVSLANLVLLAFDLKPYQLAAPGWLETERFDVAAKVAEKTTRPQFREMLRNLLEERFRMTYHHGSKINAVI